MRCVGNVAHMGESKCLYSVWWENLRERDHLKDQGVDERLLLKLIFRKWDMGHELD